MIRDLKLRTVFDQAARDYDSVRPGYPPELIEDIVTLSAIPADGRILEIGCGTGQATVPFASHGYSMVCLDIGRELISLATEKCRPFSNVQILNVSFEDFQTESAQFDLVMSASAFHWIPPEVGYPKAAQLLKEHGSLAIFTNMHPRPWTGFFETVQKIYREVVPEWQNPAEGPTTEDQIRATELQIEATGLFGEVIVRRYKWEVRFSRDQYVKLLDTYSDHRNLDEDRRSRLFSEIGDLIDLEFGGIVVRPYLSVLYVARREMS